MVPIFQTSLHI